MEYRELNINGWRVSNDVPREFMNKLPRRHTAYRLRKGTMDFYEVYHQKTDGGDWSPIGEFKTMAELDRILAGADDPLAALFG